MIRYAFLLILAACTAAAPIPASSKCYAIVATPEITAGLVCRNWSVLLGLTDCSLYGRPVSDIEKPANVIETECK